jgi:hypothetical protein
MSDGNLLRDKYWYKKDSKEYAIIEFKEDLQKVTTPEEINIIRDRIEEHIATAKGVPGDENKRKEEDLGYLDMCKGYVNQRECQIKNPDSNCDNLSNFTDASSSSSDSSSGTSDGSSESGSNYMSQSSDLHSESSKDF